MRLKTILSCGALCGAFIASGAMAQNYSSPWIFSSTIGTDVAANGTFVNDGIGNISDFSGIDPAFTSSSVQMRGRKFDDMYKTNIRTSFEVRYALSNLTELFGSIGYLKADGKSNVAMGCAISDTTTSDVCDVALTGTATDLEQYMVELGYRQWLGGSFVKNKIKPYYAVHGGFAYTKAIGIDMKAGDVNIGQMAMYDKGFSYTLGSDFGASYTLSKTLELAAEVGVRYTDKLKKDKANDCSLGVCGTNDKSGQFTVPVSLRLNSVF